MILLVHRSFIRERPTWSFPDHLTTEPSIPFTAYRDGFGNCAIAWLPPAGRLRPQRERDYPGTAARPDECVPDARSIRSRKLPEETLVFLLGSRYAKRIFCRRRPGSCLGPRLRLVARAGHLRLRPQTHRLRLSKCVRHAQRGAGLQERAGVCRDHAHLAIAFCRCMNIPARYCTGYLGDVGSLHHGALEIFAAWIEVYLGGRWHTFDPRKTCRGSPGS